MFIKFRALVALLAMMAMLFTVTPVAFAEDDVTDDGGDVVAEDDSGDGDGDGDGDGEDEDEDEDGDGDGDEDEDEDEDGDEDEDEDDDDDDDEDEFDLGDDDLEDIEDDLDDFIDGDDDDDFNEDFDEEHFEDHEGRMEHDHHMKHDGHNKPFHHKDPRHVKHHEDFDFDDFYEDYDPSEFEEEHRDEFKEEIKREIQDMRSMLRKAVKFHKILVKMDIPRPGVQKAIKKLGNVVEKGHDVIERMHKLMESGDVDEEKMDHLWETMDRLGEVVDEIFDIIVNYLDERPELREQLKDENRKIVDFFVGGDHHGGHEKHRDRFDQFYDGYDQEFVEGFVEEIHEEVMEEVMRRVTDEVMARVARHVGDEVAKKVMYEIMDDMEVFGDKAERLLDHTTRVHDRIGDVDTSRLEKRARALFERTRSSVLTSEIADSLADLWDEVAELAASEDASVEDGAAVLDEIEDLLDENDEELVFGEEAIEFYDVQFEDPEWYYQDVMSMREAGFVSGARDADGKLTGKYLPGNESTYAEVYRVVMEAAGHGEADAEGGEWWAGYYERAVELGFPVDFNWNAPATRGDVAMIIAIAFDLEDVEYDGVFSDVDSDDEHADYYQAVYDAEIFTGEGDTGRLNPSGRINRAALAKVIRFALNHMNEGEFIDGLDELDI